METKSWWVQKNQPPRTGEQALYQCLHQVKTPFCVVDLNGIPAFSQNGAVWINENQKPSQAALPLLARVGALDPQKLGDPDFKSDLGLTHAYVMGAMANGISSVDMVKAAGKAGMLGIFGAAGLSPDKIRDTVQHLKDEMGQKPFGFNLIHSPQSPDLEWKTVEIYRQYQVPCVSASAYLNLTPALVWFRVKGIRQTDAGRIQCASHLLAKVSRVEVARRFMSPPPEKILRQLAAEGRITEQEARLAEKIPMADDITAEADSGGHTDNRPAISLFPTICALRDQICAARGYTRPIRVGLGGGIATPASAAAAFSMGAAYLVTGSVNQACVEAGTSQSVRKMLAEAGQADVTMAPAADMFEMGVKVQVLKRGTLFPFRAAKLYDLYARYEAYEQIPASDRAVLERDILRSGFEEAWQATRAFFETRDPAQIVRAEKDPGHKMALVFRSYLGQSSKWAVCGEASRKIDYQIWCGQAMGAFNEWAGGSFLEKPENRSVVGVALNLLVGAAVLLRANWLRFQGIDPGPAGFRFSPKTLEEIRRLTV